MFTFNKYKKPEPKHTMISYVEAMKLFREATGETLANTHQYFKDNFSMGPIRVDIVGSMIRQFYLQKSLDEHILSRP